MWVTEHRNRLSREIVKVFKSHLGMVHEHSALADTALSRDVKLSDLQKYLTRLKDSIIPSYKNMIPAYKFIFSIILHIYTLLYCSKLHIDRLLFSKNDSQYLCIHRNFIYSYILFSYTCYVLLYRVAIF